MKTIFFFVVSLETGGLENYLLRFLHHSKHRYKVYVVCKSGKVGSLYEDYKDLGATIIPLKIGYINIKALFSIYNLIRDKNPDTVCDMTSNFAGLIVLIARLANIKNRISYYRQSTNHFSETKPKLAYNYLVNRLVYYNSTSILANSQYALEFFFKKSEIDNKRFNVINNGVNVKKFAMKKDKRKYKTNYRIPINKFIIGHVGRVNPAKNHETILKVANRIYRIDTSIHFVICGRGTSKLLTTHKNLENVSALGHQENIPEILQAFDLFYFPSITEGQPNALIEAMIAGLPILTSNIAPILECIPESYFRFAVEPHDIEKTVELILNLKNRISVQDVEILKNWAIKKYDSKKQFRIFSQYL